MRKIKQLMFEGGGPKGLAYAGVIPVLAEKNILCDVERVAGTSAGAITALLLCLGYPPGAITDMSRNIDLTQFQDRAGFTYTFPLVQEFGIYRGDALLHWFEERVKEKLGNPQATFADLRARLLLQQADINTRNQQNKYRDLAVIGTNISTGYSELFSFETTPELSLAKAARISMSIPFYFVPVKETKAGQTHYYNDGGIHCNYPLSVFDSPHRSPAETLGFRVDSSDEVAILRDGLAPPIQPINNIIDYTKAVINTILNNETNRHRDSDDDFRTVYISVGNIKTTDFSLTEAQKDALIASGYEATTTFLNKTMPYYDTKHQLARVEQDKQRLQKKDRKKLFRKANQVFFSTTDSQTHIQWVFPASENRLKNKQKMRRYAERLYEQPELDQVEYSEAAVTQAADVIDAIGTPELFAEAIKYSQTKTTLQQRAAAFETNQLVRQCFWRRSDYRIGHDDALPKALFEAAINNELVRLDNLLRQGIRTDYVDDHGYTALHHAARKGYVEVVKRLIQFQANGESPDYYGDTPMHLAARFGQLSVLEALSAYSLSVNAVNKYGNTPLHHAVALSEGMALEHQQSVIQWLLTQGAKLDAKDHQDRTPIDLAKALGRTEIVEWVSKYVDLETRSMTLRRRV